MKEWCIIHGVFVSAKRYPYDFERRADTTYSVAKLATAGAANSRCAKLQRALLVDQIANAKYRGLLSAMV